MRAGQSAEQYFDIKMGGNIDISMHNEESESSKNRVIF